MGVLMLIFAMTVSGQPGMAAMQFKTMEQCEATRGEALKAVKEEPPGGSPLAFVAAVCVRPVKLEDA